MTTSPRPGRPQRPQPGGRPGRADLEQQLKRVVARLDTLQEAVELLVEDPADEDPAYAAAVNVQVRRRGMRLVVSRG